MTTNHHGVNTDCVYVRTRSGNTSHEPTEEIDPEKVVLLSSKDPLSLPIMCSGGEDGGKDHLADGTIYFSMLVILIGIILSSYPYSSSPDMPPVHPQAPTEGTTTWQTNLQGIHNLMGFVADMVTTLQLYTYHLCFTPHHLSLLMPNISVCVSPATRSPMLHIS